ncbi:cell division protein FtsI [Pelomonas sp. V22]|uniref:cell division protein FtsI n=1 Tax=Pelomonas sp. V22 TaxID=2822139 RepID=UPI0024A81585|nr:cell division protein FtsI [Pelomonas sp. V22]MDI4633524.1 cell division protein FtsI [Pelomonas sp. V22]
MRAALAGLAALGLLSACSVMAPLQAWGLVKAADVAGTTAIAYAPGKAINTVHHGEPVMQSLCIEYNRATQLEDLVPALQLELREQGVSSRVYEPGSGQQECRYWLRYAATIEWGQPPLADGYRAYLSSAALSLHNANGNLMASSAYAVDSDYGSSKWSTTRRKLAPVVKAVITGFSS